ncbi:MAG: DNA primase [Bacteroidales bacterium]|nr:DNA primase [Bacteroidales bacterium]MCL2739065.1 DNA primase [Bacteroidales bacterium]
MIDRSVISRIIDTAQIVEVIGEFVTLKRRGANYMACCPFHNEKTPSFSVSPAKGIYKCFGCGKAGNVVNFVMEHEQLSYVEALKYLGKKYGITVEEEEEGPEAQANRLKHEAMMSASAFAQKYYNDSLWNTPMGKAVGLSYFRERGFTDATIRNFQLGFAPDHRDSFSKAALAAGHPQDILVATGLSIHRESESDDRPAYLTDRFYDRVLFSIHSLSGRVVAFGGRTLRTDKASPKYINSPESEIYSKSRSLYGLFFAKQAITRAQKCYLVEGYTDVLSLFQAGIENVVASGGTSLTTDQTRLIKRFAPQVTVLFDGDEAGIKASLRGIDMLLEEGLQVKVVLFPHGEDPDSFANSHSPKELLDFLNQSEQDFIGFKINLLLKEGAKDPLRRAQLINDVVHSISVIPDAITRSVYMEESARRLNVEEGVLVQEVAAQRRKRIFGNYHRELAPETEPPPAANIPVPSFITQTYCATAEKELIYYLLKFGQHTLFTRANLESGNSDITVAQYITAELRNDELEFQNLLYKNIFDEYSRISQASEQEQSRQEFKQEQPQQEPVKESADLEHQKYFINHPDIAVAEVALELLDDRHPITIKHYRDAMMPEELQIAKAVPKAVLVYKSKITGQAYNALCAHLEKAQAEQNQEQMSTLMEQIRILLRIRNAFSHELKRLTL